MEIGLAVEHLVGEPAQPIVVTLGNAEHPRNDGDGQNRGEVGDHVATPLRRDASEQLARQRSDRRLQPCDALGHARAMAAPKWFIAQMVTAAAAGLCGDDEAAAEARERLLTVTPSFEAEAVGLVDLWRFNPPLRDAVLDGLQAAGLELHSGEAGVGR